MEARAGVDFCRRRRDGECEGMRLLRSRRSLCAGSTGLTFSGLLKML